MRYIGPGYSVTNYPKVGVENSAFPEEFFYDITPEGQTIANEIIATVYAKRGEFISRSIDIEYVLGKSISDFFFETDSERKELFHQHIIDHPFFSFMEKKKVLESIMAKHPEKFPAFERKERDDLFKYIKSIIDVRNAFAHGEIIIDVNNRIATLRFLILKRIKKMNTRFQKIFSKN